MSVRQDKTGTGSIRHMINQGFRVAAFAYSAYFAVKSFPGLLRYLRLLL